MKIKLSRTALAALTATAFGLGATATTVDWLRHAEAAPQSTPVQIAQASPAAAPAAAPLVSGLPDFTTLVEQTSPSVVNISVIGKPSRVAVNPNDPMFEFFRRFGIPVPQNPQRGGEGPAPRGIGSGFVISPDGYILTNAHVVADAAEVTVKFTDKREYKAKVIGSDKRTDVALIKIDAKNLPAVKLGNAETTRVGEWVAAIGAPFGFENTVTAGIVSAKSRALPDESLVPFIQTDVAINPGNSGGPLFNLNGEVIGINSQIYSRTGGFMGLSFAIPIDVAMRVADQIKQYGRAKHARLGVSIQPITRELADSFGLDRARGALVANVEQGGPADKAGLQAGDVILSVDGRAVSDSFDLPKVIGNLAPGKTVKMKVWRQGAERDLSATLGEQSDSEVAALDEGGRDSGPIRDRLGLAVRPLTGAESQQLGVTRGLVVADAGGVAAQAGIQPGDAILAVNGQPVGSAEELAKLVEKAKGRIALLIQRGDNRLFVPIRVG
ncbi:DegQ family serine endoprotease [Methyloversatilis discipulorum]|uniref:DegQ family serine endoprotease n=1 Tax=Methyloversatilis discipulorum TaxID=1119528 RepID=UPI001A5D757D|nr:DegQ family serine endoprotease [Methyloversatilis discipulorum]MBL8468132.1 DegQ family serine endoprotease [Methyloversatilis discipulorum]